MNSLALDLTELNRLQSEDALFQEGPNLFVEREMVTVVNMKRRMLLSVYDPNRGTVRDCHRVVRRHRPPATAPGNVEGDMDPGDGPPGGGVELYLARRSVGSAQSAASMRSLLAHRQAAGHRIFDTELVDMDGDLESDEDDLHQDDSAPPSARDGSVYEPTRSTYLRACRRLGIIPSSNFLENINSEDLVMRNHVLGVKGTKACAIALVNNIHIKRIDLTGNNIRCRGASYIAEMLTSNGFITSLTLSHNNICSSGLHDLTEVLKENISIKSLNISGNCFQDSDATCIADLLENNSTIETLDLSHNGFCEVGGIEIGTALANNHTVTSLNLSWNHLRRKGAVAIADGIKRNKYLREVLLAWNGLALEGSVGVGAILESNTTLATLDLTNNRINKDHLTHILRGLKRNSTLVTLKIGLNPITADGAMLFLEVLKQCPNVGLQELDLTGQCVDMGFVETLEMLQKSRVLHITYDIVLEQHDIARDDEDFLNADPMIVLMEFMRQKNMRLVDLFTKLDADGSKSLSRKEFKDGLLAVNIPLSSKGLDKLLDNLDKDGDGEVDFAELMEGQKEYRRKVTKMQAKSKKDGMDNDDNEITKISRKVSSLLLAREAAQKFKEPQNAADSLEQTQEEKNLMSMSRKVQSLLKAKTAIGSFGRSHDQESPRGRVTSTSQNAPSK